MSCELAVLFCFPWKASKQVTMGPVESFHGTAKTVHLFRQNSGNFKKNGGNFESFHKVHGNYQDSVESNPGRTKLTKYINKLYS
jgi:hypothetical protein